MNKGYRHIICAWALLVFFAAGQWAVFAHQHKTFVRITRATHGVTISEKCQLCDAMHHNNMIRPSKPLFSPVTVTRHIFKQDKYNFVSISLILFAGRAPPVA